MATAVPSRFAVLAIEEDDFKPKKTSKAAVAGKINHKNKGDKPKQQPKKDDKKKQSKVKCKTVHEVSFFNRSLNHVNVLPVAGNYESNFLL